MNRPPVHAIVYAPAGGRKSTFAATFPKPLRVLAFDPMGKMAPYGRRGAGLGGEVLGEYGQAVVEVRSKVDPARTIIRIDGFYDDQLLSNGGLNPVAYERFLALLPEVYDEVRAGMWRTVVIDTLTSMSLASKNLHQYKLHPTEKDSRKWYAQTTDDLEQAICCRLVGALRNVNFLVLAHVDNDKDEVLGTMVGQPAAPGRLSKQDGLPARFPEMYYLRTKRDKTTGVITTTVQTQPSNTHNAMSVSLYAPDGCDIQYDALFTVWDTVNTEPSPSSNPPTGPEAQKESK